MKLFLAILTSFTFLSFNDTNNIVFESADKKCSITAFEGWVAAGNMKGVEIFISRENDVKGVPSTAVLSKDENLLEDVTLDKYSAGKIFLQTAVLNTTPSVSETKTINNLNFKYYEYEYTNKDMVVMKSLVYHTLINNTGYQLVITSKEQGFELNRAMFNFIANSIKIK